MTFGAPTLERVTERQPERRWPGTGLDDVLLDVKLSVPHLRPGLVSRSALIDTVRTSSAVAVGVTAPAGYGKSTLLVEWADSEPRRVAWISLDRLDDDPSALLYLIASAYERAVPEQAGLAAEISGLGISALGRGAPRLAATLSRAPVPFVLLLDDLHELRSHGCHDVLGVVLSGIPPGSQVVTASRTAQPHLPRLRAVGDAVELRAPDLALDRSAAERIFATAQVAITPEQASDVTQRTEGWPVGLHLAAMIARDAPHGAWRISGDDRYVADYLHQEALSKLDPAMQQFLRRTAVLDRLHGPLCDAILEESGSHERLRALEESHAFLIPLDRRREWYRYHPLFREFLLGELRRSEPDLIEKLHVRAADWFEATWLPGHGCRPPLDDAREGPVCPAGGLTGAGDVRRGADLHRAALADRPRRVHDQGVPTPRGPGRLGHRSGRRDQPRPNVGRRSWTRLPSTPCRPTGPHPLPPRGRCCAP